MHKPIKYVEKAVTVAAKGAWAVFDSLNQINQNPSFTPKWSDKPLLKSYQKQKPPLGWPRTTDSLCPRCVPEIRQQILVERDSQKAIVIGKGGRCLKAIGAAARAEIAEHLGRPVHLFLHVKVNPRWDEDRGLYREIGLEWAD